MERLDEALSHMPELVEALAVLCFLLSGIPPKRSAAAFKDPRKVPLALPEGALRDEFAKLLEHLEAADTASGEVERTTAVAATIQAALRVLQQAKDIFKHKQTDEFRTPMDIYRRRFVRTGLSAFALVVIPCAIALTAYRLSLPHISIVEASYGHNCDGAPGLTERIRVSAPRGNATQVAAALCNNRRAGCRIPVTAARFGDPAPLCAKEFQIVWRCEGDSATHGATLSSEAAGKTLALTCGGNQESR